MTRNPLRHALAFAFAGVLASAAGLACAAPAEAAASAPGPLKVLRLTFDTAETGFDPAQVNDIFSK